MNVSGIAKHGDRRFRRPERCRLPQHGERRCERLRRDRQQNTRPAFRLCGRLRQLQRGFRSASPARTRDRRSYATYGAFAGVGVTGDSDTATGNLAESRRAATSAARTSSAGVTGNSNAAYGAFAGQSVTGDRQRRAWNCGRQQRHGVGHDRYRLATRCQSADGAIAMGQDASASGANAVAIGAGATATGSIAVGASASASSGGAAFGDFSQASGTDSAALGPNATAAHMPTLTPSATAPRRHGTTRWRSARARIPTRWAGLPRMPRAAKRNRQPTRSSPPTATGDLAWLTPRRAWPCHHGQVAGLQIADQRAGNPRRRTGRGHRQRDRVGATDLPAWPDLRRECELGQFRLCQRRRRHCGRRRSSESHGAGTWSARAQWWRRLRHR